MKRFRPSIAKNLILISFIGIFLFLTNYFTNAIMKPEKKIIREQPSIGGNFVLMDQNEKVFNSSFIKKYKLIYFGYTYCPDVCPFDILKLDRLFSENTELKQKIVPIFITVDPKRDSVEIIKNFLENFSVKIVGLTGTANQIDVVLKQYKIYRKFSEDINFNDDYLINHTSLFYLVNENDQYIQHFSSQNFFESTKKFFSNYKF
tara:strand:+ start:311 stop:922 length:612 start_codon:yes stop_codon:yes gene_type:complete